jgi:hypothetical protein
MEAPRDFDQNGGVNAHDFSDYFIPDNRTGIDSGRGTDMNCDGRVNSTDFYDFFAPQFSTTGVPGPSGRSCAGTVPCP